MSWGREWTPHPHLERDPTAWRLGQRRPPQWVQDCLLFSTSQPFFFSFSRLLRPTSAAFPQNIESLLRACRYTLGPKTARERLVGFRRQKWGPLYTTAARSEVPFDRGEHFLFLISCFSLVQDFHEGILCGPHLLALRFSSPTIQKHVDKLTGTNHDMITTQRRTTLEVPSPRPYPPRHLPSHVTSGSLPRRTPRNQSTQTHLVLTTSLGITVGLALSSFQPR